MIQWLRSLYPRQISCFCFGFCWALPRSRYPLGKRKRLWGSFFGKSFFPRVTHPAVLSAAVLTPGSGQGQGPKGKGWPSLLISFWSRFFPGLLQGRDGKKRKGNGRKWKRREERKERKQHCKEMDLTSKPGLLWNIFLFFYTLGRIIPTDSYFSEG